MGKPSNCKTCNTGAHIVRSESGLYSSIPFWYCRGCKDEVTHAHWQDELTEIQKTWLNEWLDDGYDPAKWEEMYEEDDDDEELY